MEMEIPHRQELCSPVFQAIKELGGSATKQELNDTVARNLRLTEAEINKPYGPNPAITELKYELAWALTELKLEYGLIDNPALGVWALTELGSVTDTILPKTKRGSLRSGTQRQRMTMDRVPTMSPLRSDSAVAGSLPGEAWRAQLLEALHNVLPDAFERLCQRLLRESGFVEVKVTGRSGDGGIEGVGRLKVGDLLGLPIAFQCKRWQGNVSSNVVREFRGAMTGRADRGLILTTGTFTRVARQEAASDGAPPIDLLDGQDLVDQLKELQFGVSVNMTGEVVVDRRWFEQL